MKHAALLALALSLIGGSVWAFSQKKPDTQSLAAGAETLWIKRSANAASCEGEGEPLAIARKDLENNKIRVLQEKRAGDGMMHIQMCGADTGEQNYFQILKSDLEKAKAQGFSEAPGFSPKEGAR
jgi:hypothetical protein